MTVAIVRTPNSKSISMEAAASSTSASTPSSINSRSAAIKTILLGAWRAKLTNEEWETRVRKVLPRGVNGDVYDLADSILRQALIGPVPNQLFISYLKHAVQTELVSHSAVLRSIANQPINLRSSSHLLYRTSSLVCILEFIKIFRDKISCNGTEVECLNLCHSLSDLIHWLLRCIFHTLEFMISLQPSYSQYQQQQFTNIPNITSSSSATLPPGTIGNSNSLASNHDTTFGIIDLCTETIHYFIEKPFTKSLLFIDKIEYATKFDDNITRTAQSILQKISSFPQMQSIQEKKSLLRVLNQLTLTFNSKEHHPSTVAALQLAYLQAHGIRSTQVPSANNFEKKVQQFASQPLSDSSTNYALFNSLYPLVAFDAILRPARPNIHLARQIVTITNFNSAPVCMAYCELIRVCLIGLIDSHGNSKAKASWSFFTFLKLPRLLIELNRLFRRHASSTAISPTDPNQSNNFITDLKLAFERLCEYSPLLDGAEYKCNCDLLKCLVKELIKNDPSLANQKNLDIRKLAPPRRQVSSSGNNNSLGGHMMLKTEPCVTIMLDELNKDQDPTQLFTYLCEACMNISFEYTLSAAAATGRLHLLVIRLIEHNELYQQPRQGMGNSQAQRLIFDITFLMLIYIAQRYGPKLVEKNKASFNKWYHERYEQDSCFNCPTEMLKDSDDQVVSDLLHYLLGQSNTIYINWRLVVFNLPKAVSEILNAWEQKTLTDEDISTVIVRLRTKMCFMAVVAASWLRFHIRTLSESDRAKPLHILHSLAVFKHQDLASLKQQDASGNTDLKKDGFKERSSVMGAVVKRIYLDLVPAKDFPGTSASPTRVPNRNQASASNTLISASTTSAATLSNGSNNSSDSDDSQDDQAYSLCKDKFISRLTTQEIFIANVKQCLTRGWLDYDSLNSLNSLFKIIGSACFTRLIVDQILTSYELPRDLARAVNITFGLFHLDIEACAFALLKDVIPNRLMGERKLTPLNQPRAFALANLTVMTLIEVYSNLRSSANRASDDGDNILDFDHDRKLNLNGLIKKEPGVTNQESPMSLDLNGPPGVKRVKLAQGSSETQDDSQRKKGERLDRLNELVADLMRLFKEIMSDPVISHRTLFPVLFLQQAVICAREESSVITVHLHPEILLDIIDLFSSEMTFELVLAISNLSSTNSRRYTAKAVCKLAHVIQSKQESSPTSQANESHHHSGGLMTVGAGASIPHQLDPHSTSSQAGKLGGTGQMPMIIG